MLRILANNGRRKNIEHIIVSLFRDFVVLNKFPEILVSGIVRNFSDHFLNPINAPRRIKTVLSSCMKFLNLTNGVKQPDIIHYYFEAGLSAMSITACIKPFERLAVNSRTVF